jgi:hypothetical protein
LEQVYRRGKVNTVLAIHPFKYEFTILGHRSIYQINVNTSRLRKVDRKPITLQDGLPASWTPMSEGTTTVLIPLDEGNEEYRNVNYNFKNLIGDTLTPEVISVSFHCFRR